MDTTAITELTQDFAALAADLHGAGDNEAALHRAVELSVKYIEGCACASITVVQGRKGQTIAASDELARQADALQYDLGEGPCLQAAWDGGDYLMFDVSGERRWPNYAEALERDTPIRSVLAFRLPARESAALNLFAVRPGSFVGEAVTVGAVFAAHVSSLVALYEAEQLTANLRSALDSSRLIGAAVGILMRITGSRRTPRSSCSEPPASSCAARSATSRWTWWRPARYPIRTPSAFRLRALRLEGVA